MLNTGSRTRVDKAKRSPGRMFRLGWLLEALILAGCSTAAKDVLTTSRDGGDDGQSVEDDSASDSPTGSATEACGNGMDDDGDGRIDEDCPCQGGESQACFGGDYPSREVGICRDGIQTCNIKLEFGDWGDFPCEGDVLPQAEECDGMDHDCDGAVDEGCGCTPGESRDCGTEFSLAPPCSAGTQLCGDDGTWASTCKGARGPSAELCGDGIDNDCDGKTDPDAVCACAPVPEVCDNGIDDDCDGIVDEGCECTPGKSRACASQFPKESPCTGGTQACKSDGTWANACEGAVGPAPETCGDGIDQDCDGSDLPCSPTSSAAGTISAGHSHTCAVVNGSAKCWGMAQDGKLGFIVGAHWGINSPVPGQVAGLTSGVEAVAGGIASSCALVNGGVMCWGMNMWSDAFPSEIPAQVPGLESGVQAISGLSFDQHACAILNGGAMCWGHNYYGQLGDGTTTDKLARNPPVQVMGLTSGVQSVTVGRSHTCALVNGGVLCWGRGRLGTDANAPVGIHIEHHDPRPVIGLESGVQALSGGFGVDTTCAIVNGAATCWGSGGFGELGDSSGTVWTHIPVQVAGLPGDVQAIATGCWNTCAIVNGGAWCWGRGDEGTLGAEPTDSCLEANYPCAKAPVQVTGLQSGVQAITVGCTHACAVVNGSVMCWGRNHYGQVGQEAKDLCTDENGDYSCAKTPVPVTGL